MKTDTKYASLAHFVQIQQKYKPENWTQFSFTQIRAAFSFFS